MSQVPPSPGVSSDRTLMVVLSYLWILALIPLLTKKEDKEVQWHAKNGLAILVAEIACWLILTMLGFVMPGGIMLTLNCALWIAFLIVRVVCIMQGVNGQRFRVPVISDFADKF